MRKRHGLALALCSALAVTACLTSPALAQKSYVAAQSARNNGATASDVHLGSDASETNVKRAQVAD
jgi:hypothetical protein